MVESNIPQPVRRVVVLGGGTAGFLAGLAFKQQLPDLEVTIVRSTKMGVIGVGEGTIVSVVHFLHNFLGIDPREFHNAVEPSIKLGIRYLWGERPYFNYTFTPQLTNPRPGLSMPPGYLCRETFDFADMTSALMSHDKACLRGRNGAPQFPGGFAYHLENRKFVGYLEDLADRVGLSKVDDIVADVEKGPAGISSLVLESGRRIDGDFFIDCSGFSSRLLGKELGAEYVSFADALLCDRAVVGGWERTDEPYHPFTTAETMDAGWSWRIEHDDLINRGYVFSTRFLSEDEAIAEFRRKNPKLGDVRSVPFPGGAHRETWIGNVIALGNAAGFVEPLEATAIGMICDGVLNTIRVFQASGCAPMPAQRHQFNQMIYRNWTIIRDFLALHYKYNTRLDTPFWKTAREEVSLGAAADLCAFYEDVGPDLSLLAPDLKRDFFGAEGYLAMLVGQAVPYRRADRPSTEEVRSWDAWKDDLRFRARDGMSVQECCDHLREHGLPHRVQGHGALGWA
jgi:tryptophan halogenase